MSVPRPASDRYASRLEPCADGEAQRVRSTTLRRSWRAIGWGLVAVIIWLSLTPHPITIPLENGDKVGHVAAYATQLDMRHRSRLAYAIGFVALGVTLELAQGLTDYRFLEFADMAANAIGVMIGWTLSPPRGPDMLGFVERALSSIS
jgi:hypothetical protein